jgi:hypothetical protein
MPKHAGFLIIIVNCILLSAFIGGCVDCKNMHSVNSNNSNTELLLLLLSSTPNKNGT